MAARIFLDDVEISDVMQYFLRHLAFDHVMLTLVTLDKSHSVGVDERGNVLGKSRLTIPVKVEYIGPRKADD